jgi:hypothetical protein
MIKIRLVRKLFFSLCVFFLSTVKAQYQDRQWYLYDGLNTVVMDYNNDSLRILSKPHMPLPTYTYSSICDSTGKVSFLNNNFSLTDSSFLRVQSTTDINTDISAPVTWNGHIILDFPNSDKVVCVRTLMENIGAMPPFGGDYFQTKAYLTYIDKYENLGLGQAVLGKELIQVVDDTLCLPVAACRHANGSDWWIVIRKFRSNKFFIILITPNGYSVKEQAIGLNLPLIYGVAGKSMFSNDGKTFVFGVTLGNRIETPPWYFDVFDFDRCNGTFSNQRKINITDPYAARVQGVAISPNNRYLYVGLTRKLFQYDLWATNLDSSRIFIDTAAFNSYVGDMRLAPDGKIYITPSWIGYNLSTIEHPDSFGLACGYRINSVELGAACNAYCFPNMPCFTLGADTTTFGCDTISTVGLDLVNDVKSNIILFPNPVKEILYISIEQTNSQLNKVSHAIIYDEIGSVLIEQDFNSNENRFDIEDMFSIEVNSLNSGMYFIKLLDFKNHVIGTEKFIKD